MSKETFIIRTEWYEAISELEPTDQATIFRNLFLYHIGDTTDMVLDTFGVKLVWKLIEPTLSRNIESYDKRRETAIDNGKLGGRPEGKSIITDINGNLLPTKEDGKHYFYIIYDHELKIYKIGETQDLQARRLSIKRPTKYLQVIKFIDFGNQSIAMDFERLCIIKFKENRVKGDWFDLSSEDINTIILMSQNIQNKPANNPNRTHESLSDYVSVYDYVSVSDSDSVPVQNPLTPDSNKNYPDLALPAPGPENNEDSQFYEIEICKNLRIPPDKLIFIWNKWMNSRRDRFFTKREARNDFRSYASSIAMDAKTIQSIQPSSQPQKIIEYVPSG